jgi:hypothetical protein
MKDLLGAIYYSETSTPNHTIVLLWVAEMPNKEDD